MARVADMPGPAGRPDRGGTQAAADTEYTQVVRADEMELGEAAAVVEAEPRTGNRAEPHPSVEQQQVEAGRAVIASEQTGCQPSELKSVDVSPQKKMQPALMPCHHCLRLEAADQPWWRQQTTSAEEPEAATRKKRPE
jgi:hypothetical protein